MATTTQTQADNTYLDIASMLANPEDELKDLNPERDPFVAPRVPEGWYYAKIEYAEKDAQKRWEKKEGKDKEGNELWWYSTKVLAKITGDATGAECEYTNRIVYPEYRGTITTKLRANGASMVSGYCLAGGKPVKTKTHAGQAQALDQAIAQGLLVKIVVRHDAQFQLKDGEEYVPFYDADIKGTNNPKWPKDEQGQPIYQFAETAYHDPATGWRIATEDDARVHSGDIVEVPARIGVVVDRVAPITGK